MWDDTMPTGTQTGMQFKTHEVFISGIFHLILLGHGWLWVARTAESENTGNRELYS